MGVIYRLATLSVEVPSLITTSRTITGDVNHCGYLFGVSFELLIFPPVNLITFRKLAVSGSLWLATSSTGTACLFYFLYSDKRNKKRHILENNTLIFSIYLKEKYQC